MMNIDVDVCTDENVCTAFIAQSEVVEEPDRPLSLWAVWGSGACITEDEISTILSLDRGQKHFHKTMVVAFAQHLPKVRFSALDDTNKVMQDWWKSFSPEQRKEVRYATHLCREHKNLEAFKLLKFILPEPPVIPANFSGSAKLHFFCLVFACFPFPVFCVLRIFSQFNHCLIK